QEPWSGARVKTGADAVNMTLLSARRPAVRCRVKTGADAVNTTLASKGPLLPHAAIIIRDPSSRPQTLARETEAVNVPSAATVACAMVGPPRPSSSGVAPMATVIPGGKPMPRTTVVAQGS